MARPVVALRARDVDNDPVLAFRDLLEIMFVHAFRRHGVSWQNIRLAADRARGIANDPHPFSTLRFRTDGETVFAEVFESTQREQLLDLVRHQYTLRDIMLPSLVEQLDFGGRGSATPLRWWPAGRQSTVVVDPRRQFGEPIVDTTGVPTRVLGMAAKSGQSVREISNWYETPPKSVRHAVRFEESLAA